MNISLRRPSDDAELDRLIRTTANAKQRDRFRAIRLAIDGTPTADIQHALGRSRGFVQRWCYTYRDCGLDAVRPVKQTGRPTILPPEQHEAFRKRVIDGPTESDGVCTLRGQDIRRILEEEFGVRYSLNGVFALLDRLGLVVLCPRPQHRKSDPEAMQRWVERAPLLSMRYGRGIQASVSRSGSRTRPASASRGR